MAVHGCMLPYMHRSQAHDPGTRWVAWCRGGVFWGAGWVLGCGEPGLLHTAAARGAAAAALATPTACETRWDGWGTAACAVLRTYPPLPKCILRGLTQGPGPCLLGTVLGPGGGLRYTVLAHACRLTADLGLCMRQRVMGYYDAAASNRLHR